MADPAPPTGHQERPSGILDAATVVLLRPRKPLESGTERQAPFDLFLVRRHSRSRFMGGVYVFPGGKRDAGDGAPEVAALCGGLNGQQAASILDQGPPERALGLYVAAIRETFEEAGVLLAIDRAGQPIRAQTHRDSLRRARESLNAGGRSLAAMLDTWGWRLDLGRLRYLDHWVTPPVEPRRFSAYFFVATVPVDETASHDQRETTAGVWLSPADALRRYLDPDHDAPFELAPPTLRVLEWLRDQPSPAAAMAAAPNAPVREQMPRLVRGTTPPTLALPGDPLHPDAPGDRIDRFVMRDGRWHTERDPTP